MRQLARNLDQGCPICDSLDPSMSFAGPSRQSCQLQNHLISLEMDGNKNAEPATFLEGLAAELLDGSSPFDAALLPSLDAAQPYGLPSNAMVR